jgi:transcriptional regulator with XRE-family HTH domain
LSQEAAAERIGIHAKHLQRIETGSVNVTIATLVAVAVAYSVPLLRLFEPETAP